MKISKLNPFIKNFIAVLVLLLLQSCAPVLVRPTAPPMGRPEIIGMVSDLREQEARVSTFFSAGRVVFEANGSGSEANILVAGARDPFRVKIEITHPWGRPLFHFLAKGSEFRILSFAEKRLYVGLQGALSPDWFLPGRLDQGLLWGIARGYPVLPEHCRAVSLKGNQIIFMSAEEEPLEVIDLYSQSSYPRLVSFTGQGLSALFAEFEEQSGIRHARNIRVDDSETGTVLELQLKDRTFNKTISEDLFHLEMPAGFTRVMLRKTRK